MRRMQDSGSQAGPQEFGPGRTVAFTGLMAAVMGVAIFSSPVLGILSRFLIDDAGLSRTQLGWLAALVSLTAALSGPTAGHIADRVGGRRMAVAAGLVAGAGQAGANPSTNKLIGLYVPKGRRGLVQSGVQMGVFVGGLVLPGAAVAWGWRTALALTAIVPLVGLLLVPFIVPKREPAESPAKARPRDRGPLPHQIRWLAMQGVAVGCASGAAITFLPLFAEEEVGVSVTTAGAVAAVYGLAGLFGRLFFPHYGEKRSHLAFPMLLVTMMTLVGVVLLWSAPNTGLPFLWIGGALVGVIPAWTALAMLAVITTIDQDKAGRASGYVSAGFGLGLATGPAVFGSLVDASGAYHLGWAFVLVMVIVAAVLMAGWVRTDPSRAGTGGADLGSAR
jgi:MFS family permease